MNKIYLFVAVVLLSINVLNAQKSTPSIAVEIGPKKIDQWGRVADQIFHLENGNILMLKSSKSSAVLNFRLYDSEMKFIDSYNLNKSDFYKDWNPEERVRILFFREVKDKFQLFYSIERGNELEVMTCHFDAENRTFNNTSRKIFSRKLNEESEHTQFTFARSSNNTRYLITMYEEKLSGEETAYHYLMTDDLRVIKKVKFSNLKRTNGYVYTGSAVNNEGTIVSTAFEIELRDEPEIEERVFVPLYLQFLRINETKPIVKEIDIEDKQLGDIVLGFNSEGNEIVVGGIYKEPLKLSSAGIFLAKYDANYPDAILEELTVFDEDLKQSMFKFCVERDLEDPGLIDQQLVKIIQDKDQGFYFIMDSGTAYASKGITVINLDNSGVKRWDKHILRIVSGLSEFKFNASLKLISFIKDDEFHLLINQGSNFNRLNPSTNYTLEVFLKPDLVHYSFNEEGDYTYDKILVFKDAGTALLNSYAYKDGSIYFKAGGRMRKSRLVRAKIYED